MGAIILVWKLFLGGKGSNASVFDLCDLCNVFVGLRTE